MFAVLPARSASAVLQLVEQRAGHQAHRRLARVDPLAAEPPRAARLRLGEQDADDPVRLVVPADGERDVVLLRGGALVAPLVEELVADKFTVSTISSGKRSGYPAVGRPGETKEWHRWPRRVTDAPTMEDWTWLHFTAAGGASGAGGMASGAP